MSTIQLDCSQLRDIRLHSDLPNSIYLDAETFLRQFESIVQSIPQTRELTIEEITANLISGWMSAENVLSFKIKDESLDMAIDLAKRIKIKCKTL
jgi:hypothetical protein